jgi:predicted Na+-dependent transporter
MFAPVLLEVGFDNLMWHFGKSDKPISTWVVRPLLFGIAVIVVIESVVDNEEWWQVLAVVFCYHFLFFNYLINWTLKRPFFYLSKKNLADRLLANIPSWPRLFLQMWLLLVAIMGMYRW